MMIDRRASVFDHPHPRRKTIEETTWRLNRRKRSVFIKIKSERSRKLGQYVGMHRIFDRAFLKGLTVTPNYAASTSWRKSLDLLWIFRILNWQNVQD